MSTQSEPREGWIGVPVRRVEDPLLLLGRGAYVDDVPVANAFEVAFVRSPHSHARIISVDIAAAVQLPGVEAILTGQEAAERCPGWRGVLAYPGMKAGLQRPLALDKVRFVGEPVVAIAAASRAIAEDAADLVEVVYEPLPAVVDPELALAADAPRVHPDLEDNLSWRNEFASDDFESAQASADLVVRRVFRTGRHTGVPMEGRAILADYDPFSRSLTLHHSSQALHMHQHLFAALLGLEDHHVRVIARHVGGAFGMKAHVYPDEVATCILAMKLGRPVKWIQDRLEGLVGDVAARDERLDLSMGFRTDGTLVAMRADILADGGAYSVYPRASVTEPNMISRILPGPYRFGSYAFTARLAITTKQSLGHYRAVGHPVAILAHESLMDIAARELALDPAEIRRRNLLGPDDLPFKNAIGNVYSDIACLETLDTVLREVDYPALRDWQRDERAKGRIVGIGLATFIEGTAPGAQFYAALGAPIQAADSATVRIEPNGSVVALTGTPGQGQGLRTTASQLIAHELGIGLDDVSVIDGDTAVVPYGSGLWAARSSVALLGAVRTASQALVEKVKRIGAHLLECDVADLDLRDRALVVRGTERTLPLREIAMTAHFRTPRLPPGMERGLEATAFFEPPPMTWINGTHLAIVELARRTGGIRLLRYVALDDCGTQVNPFIVAGQIRGGVVQGIGGALFEHLQYDDQGQLLNGTLMDYIVPLASDVPDVELIHLETPATSNPNGTKGAGEAGTSGAPAAIANAVNDALAPFGAEIHTHPITPELVLDALERAGAPAGSPAT